MFLFIECKFSQLKITSSILLLSALKLFLLKALKVPAIVAESGMILNADPA